MDWRNKPNQIFNKVKQQMFAKGVQTFHFLDIFIQQFDPSDTRVLSSHFFNLFLNKVGVFLSTQEIRNIRDLYSKNKEQDLILYRDFLEDVKYSISQKIAGLINQAFSALDKNNEGSVGFKELTAYYNNQEHPHSITRRKEAEDVQNQFLSAIQRKVDAYGRISKEAFIDYYAELNFCIPAQKQSFFEQLIINTWNLKTSADNVSQKRLKELQHIIYEKIRLKSDGKTNEWKTGKKALSYFDLGDNKLVEYPEFKRGLDKFGCNFQEYEMKALFDKYSQAGRLDYQTFAKVLMDLDINGMISQPNLFQTKMGTNHFKVTH